MLKRKLVMTVLPLLTAGILVGSGFSAWTFGSSSASTSLGIGFQVTPIDERFVSIYNDVTPTLITLDQVDKVNLLNKDVGITFNYDYEVSVAADSSVSKIDLSLAIKLDSGSSLNNYIQFNPNIGSDLSAINSNLTTASINGDTLTIAGTFNVTYGQNNSFEFTLNSGTHNHIFDWKDTKPQNSAGYRQMVKDLETAGVKPITFTLTATKRQ